MGRSAFNIYHQTDHPVDWVILLSLALLGLVGLFVLVTTSASLFWQQLAFLILGGVIIYFVSKLDPIILWWFAPYGYVISLVLLAVTFLAPPIRGASRWIVIGGNQLQPSEMVKPLLILAFARAIATYSPRSLRWIGIHLLLFAVPFLLVFRQPDLGTSLVYAASWLAMIVAGGFPIIILIAGGIAVASIFPLLWHALAPYQRGRILTFMDPAADPHGAGYNALQAMIGVGSGQVFGRGLGRGTQSHLRFLPEYHTDFIFATLVEELGLLGGLTLLILYGALLWQLIRPHVRGTIGTPFVFFYTIGLFGILFTQVFINTGMNMGIIPVTGITLPFVSYGGSSILSLSIAFGFLIALRRGAQDETSIAIH
jgi:rod shape determining protein RodA